MKSLLMILLLPALLWAQDFPFEQEIDTIPVEIDGWNAYSPWTSGTSESTPSFCDIDADDDKDLFIGEVQGYLFYFQNDGNSSIADFEFVSSALDSLTAVSGWGHSSPDFCDIDNDGDFDLFMGAGLVGYYENTGTPQAYSFALPGDTLYDTQNNYVIATHIELVDIDADDDYDLFGGHYNGYIYFYRNIGDEFDYAFFLEDENWQGIDVGLHADLTFCDLDADSDYDLFIGNYDGKIYYYENIGDSVNYDFADPVYNWLGIDVGYHASPEFCDIDADGDFDLIVGRDPTYTQQHMGDVFFYENIGTPQVPNFQYVTSNYLTIDVGSGSRQQLVDIDADGDMDLFVGASDEIRFFRNTGTASDPALTLEEEYYQGISLESIIPYFCDIDADGDLDLFAGMGEIPGPPGLHLYFNRGTPQQPEYILYSEDLVPGNYFAMINPCLADIDADADFDLFITDDDNYTGTNNIWFYENLGSPTQFSFGAAVTNWQGIDIQSPSHRYLRFFDIDDDDDLDLFFNNNWMEGSENIRFYRNMGTAQSPQMQWVTSDYLPFEVITPCAWFCDIDNDNRADLFVGEGNGGILFFHGMDTSAIPPKALSPYRGPVLTLGPNPANPSTWISFTLTAPQEATLAVYNILGARITTLTSGPQRPGEHTYYWNASQNASGVYIIRLETTKYTAAQKLTVVK